MSLVKRALGRFPDLGKDFSADPRNTLARITNRIERRFSLPGSDKELRIRELEFNHVLCHIHVRVLQELVGKEVHECMSFSLDDEPGLVLLELEDLNIHLLIVGGGEGYRYW